MEEAKALELRDWIQRAAERKLIVTYAQAHEWKVNVTKKLVPLEYTRFILAEYPQSMPVAPGVEYDPRVFFQTMTRGFAPDGTFSSVTAGNFETMTTREVPALCGVLTGAEFTGPIESALIEADDGSACYGSGDGWTRYMEVDKLSEMPKIYWQPPDDQEPESGRHTCPAAL